MKKYALLIGVEEYEDGSITPVRFARADVLALAERLKRCGFVVVCLADASGQHAPRYITVIKALQGLAGELRAEDLFLFFFAGHGVEMKGQGFLLTADTPLSFPEQCSLSLSALHQTFSRLSASRRVLLLDACRNDPNSGRGNTDASLGKGFCRDVVAVAQTQPKSKAHREVTTAVLSACGPGQRAWPYEAKGHGVFTYYLLQGIDGAAWRGNELEIEDLGRYAKAEVMQWCEATGTPQPQECWYEKFGLDRLLLAAGNAPEFRRGGKTDLTMAIEELRNLQHREVSDAFNELERLQRDARGATHE